MASVGIKKRGKVYQYQFEITPVKGQRKWITKSGFKTKAEAQEEGNKAYTEYLNAGMPFKDCNISYTDYLDYWLNNYCKINLKYNTIQAYKNIIPAAGVGEAVRHKAISTFPIIWYFFPSI